MWAVNVQLKQVWCSLFLFSVVEKHLVQNIKQSCENDWWWWCNEPCQTVSEPVTWHYFWDIFKERCDAWSWNLCEIHRPLFSGITSTWLLVIHVSSLPVNTWKLKCKCVKASLFPRRTVNPVNLTFLFLVVVPGESAGDSTFPTSLLDPPDSSSPRP